MHHRYLWSTGKFMAFANNLRPAGFLSAALAGAAALALFGCASVSSAPDQISRQNFGQTKEGTPIDVYTLRNALGAEARICNYGGLVLSLKVPDRNGKLGDVVLDGRTYTLATNNYPNSLHGGVKGFDKVVWLPTVMPSADGPALKLQYLSHDGEEGYPANLSVTVVYTLTQDNALKVEYTATTDRDTVVNLTQHSYFNLAGKGTILNHVVMIAADRFTPVDSTLIPTGELRPVQGTPFDFRNPTAIGARINQDDEQLKFGKGYDHNWIINKPMGQLGLMARVYEPTSGRVLEVLSTEPGLQFYSGNFLDGTLKGKGGWVYQFRDGFCMEPQHYPDSPNKPEFPSVVLKPGQTYHNTIMFKFSVQK